MPSPDRGLGRCFTTNMVSATVPAARGGAEECQGLPGKVSVIFYETPPPPQSHFPDCITPITGG
eukprot:4808575-Pyramimonas_sp.AAC.1